MKALEAEIEEEPILEEVKVIVKEVKKKTSVVEKEPIETEVIESIKKNNPDAKIVESETETNSQENKDESTYYTLDKGNSLWSIAREHNMTVDALKKTK
ncbi:MAG: LysM domain-containing protein [Lacinutrix sp.]|uniref:LysM domain-containing protein n=1 Tax=Lacinutrix sp. TaxID=1937692 RepID=UPI0030A5D574